MSNIPDSLRYAKSHEWVRIEGGTANEVVAVGDLKIEFCCGRFEDFQGNIHDFGANAVTGEDCYFVCFAHDVGVLKPTILPSTPLSSQDIILSLCREQSSRLPWC